MISLIDDFLNKTTMYRLLVYYLGGLLLVAAGLSAIKILPYDPRYMLASAAFLVAVCWLFNAILARIWKVPVNAESALIAALILALIINPDKPYATVFFLMWAGLLAMASKYIVAIFGKHVFNPAAFGVAATALFLNQSATWWVSGNLPLLPFVFLGGILIVRKIRRSDLVLTFLVVSIFVSLAPAIIDESDIVSILKAIVLHTPLFFFAFVMITEPLTTPPRRLGRVCYAAVVGFLYAPWVHIGSFYFTPELSLLAGNVFSYLISPKFRAILSLKEIRQLAVDTYEFVFTGKHPAYAAGQYAEWTLAADMSDARGNRRYFTLASSPAEPDVRLGIKFYDKPSTFKKYLSTFTVGSTILAGSIAGDFTLPWSTKRKLAFIAGGIGVTPFRSMIQYLVDKKQTRDIVLFYSNKTENEIAYRELFDHATQNGIGLRTVYTLTDKAASPGWPGNRGFVDAAMIAREAPDYRSRIFYISGPRSMVTAFEKTLHGMGVPRRRIKTDFFPGFA